MHLKQFSPRATQKTGETTATKLKKKKINRNTKKYIYIYKCNYGIAKIINFLDKTPNQPFKFTTKNWVEINDNALGMYNTNKEIKFKTTMLKSSLSDYCDAYIIVKRIITEGGIAGHAAARKTAK